MEKYSESYWGAYVLIRRSSCTFVAALLKDQDRAVYLCFLLLINISACVLCINLIINSYVIVLSLYFGKIVHLNHLY